MNISSSIRHRFHIEIPHQKLVNISSIMKGEFTSKRDVGSTFKIDETSTNSPRGFFDVVFWSNRRKF